MADARCVYIVHNFMEHVAIGLHDSFRLAGGTGGVDDIGETVRRSKRVRIVSRKGGVELVDVDEFARMPGQFASERMIFAISNNNICPGIPQHELETHPGIIRI